MRIERSSDGEIEVMALTGEFVGSESAEFEHHVDELVAGHRVRIVLDCSCLRWIDSAGLACLLRTQTRLQPRGGEQVLAAPSDLVASTFRTLGMDRLFRTFADVAAATRYLRG